MPGRTLRLLLSLALGAATVVATQSPAGAHGHHPDPCANGYVGLSFDDGPSGDTTTQKLAILGAAHARVTYFNIGSNETQMPDLVRQEARMGMWVGNHTQTHPHLPQI